MIALPRKEEKEEGEDYNYGDVIFRRRYISVEEFLGILRDLKERKTIRVPGNPELEYNADNLSKDRRSFGDLIYSQLARELVRVEQPCIIYYSSRSGGLSGGIFNEPLINPNLPFYPDFSLGFRSLMGYEWERSYSVKIAIPDYRARIRKLVISSPRRIKVEIDTPGIPQDDVVGKYCCDTGKIHTGDFDVKNGIIELDGKIKSAYVILMTRDGEPLDIQYFPSWSSEVELSEENLESIILGGENESVEFKESINEKSKEELLETIVAFANSKGGIILIGVGNNGEIKGFRWEKEKREESLKDWLLKVIRSHCEPPDIELDVKEVSLREEPIALIEVKEGKEKPYLIRDKGPYIRSGSTDRIMARDELLHVVPTKKEKPLIW